MFKHLKPRLRSQNNQKRADASTEIPYSELQKKVRTLARREDQLSRMATLLEIMSICVFTMLLLIVLRSDLQRIGPIGWTILLTGVVLLTRAKVKPIPGVLRRKTYFIRESFSDFQLVPPKNLVSEDDLASFDAKHQKCAEQIDSLFQQFRTSKNDLYLSGICLSFVGLWGFGYLPALFGL